MLGLSTVSFGNIVCFLAFFGIVAFLLKYFGP